MLRHPYTPTRRNQRAQPTFQHPNLLLNDPQNPQRPYRAPETKKNGSSKDRPSTSKATSQQQTSTSNLPMNHNMMYASFKRGRAANIQPSFMARVSSGANESPCEQVESRKGKNHSSKLSASLIGKSINCVGRVSTAPGSQERVCRRQRVELCSFC
jgi:hypothetical protein